MSKIGKCDTVAMNELKRQAMEYYKSNGPGSGVTERMEDILNRAFFERPDDVYGYIASYFEQFCKSPKISKLVASEILDSRGQTALKTELYCVVHNYTQLTATSSLAVSANMSDLMKPEDRELVESERQKSVERAVDLIGGDLSQMLSGMDPKDQSGIDAILGELMSKIKDDYESEKTEPTEVQTSVIAEPSSVRSSSAIKTKTPKSPRVKRKTSAVQLVPDEPLETPIPGCSAVAVASQTVCHAAASVSQMPLYKYLASIRFGQVPEKLRMPLPMVTVLTSGRAAPGKLNCIKEFMVLPSPSIPLKTAIKEIMKIYNHCAKNLSGKGGSGRLCNDWGALSPQFDRPEQGLDLLEDAIKLLGFTPGKDFSLAINCAGHEMLDFEKGKYEVTAGQLKTPDELVKFWVDLLTRYPSIVAIIDPLRRQEKEQWMSLCEVVSSRCYIIGDAVFCRPGLLKDEERTDDFVASGVTFCLEQMNTITDILACVMKLEESGHQTVFRSLIGDTTDTFIADLAVGFAAKFIKIGGPCRGERIVKLNRLIEIEKELESEDRLLPGEDHVFSVIKVPVPLSQDAPVEEADATLGVIRKRSVSRKEQSSSPKERKGSSRNSIVEKSIQ